MPSNLSAINHPGIENVRQAMGKKYPGAEDALKAAGYDNDTREGMLVHMASAGSKRVPGLVETWLKTANNPADMASRKKKYAKKAQQYRLDWEKRHPEHKTQSTQGASGRSTKKMIKHSEHSQKTWDFINHILAKQIQKEKPRGPDGWVKFLQRYGIPVISLEAPLLEDKIPLKEQEKRYQFLTDYKHGLGLPSEQVNGMMMEMLNQPTVEEADRLFAYWRSVKNMPRAQREAFRRDTDERYKKWEWHEASDNKRPAVRMPWQGPEEEEE